MATLVQSNLSFARQRRHERHEFRLIFAVCFMFFLVAAIVARLLPGHGPSKLERRRRSIFEEARVAANTSIPFAFMG